MHFDDEPLYRYYPDLTIAAMRQDVFANGFRFWEYFISRGVPWQKTVMVFTTMLDCLFDIKTRQAHRILNDGADIFWEYIPGTRQDDRGKVRVFSPQEVADLLLNGAPAPIQPLCFHYPECHLDLASNDTLLWFHLWHSPLRKASIFIYYSLGS